MSDPRALVDGLLVASRADLAHVAAQRERYEGLRLLVLDHGLWSEALALGLRNVTLRRPELGPDDSARAVAQSYVHGSLIDSELATLRRQLFGPGVFDGWDISLFQVALLRLLFVRTVAAAADRFPEGRIGVLRPQVAQQCYFESAAGADLFVANDPTRWIVVDHYATVQRHRPSAYGELVDAEAVRAVVQQHGIDAVTHVPTCFYDRQRIEAEVAAAYRSTIDIPSAFWDQPVRRLHRVTAPRAALPAPDARAVAYGQRARARLAELVADLLPLPASREPQLDDWARRCEAQALDFLALRSALAGTQPRFVLCDHDTGRNGPLFSAAAALDAPITVLPHSGYPSFQLPHARRVTAVERAGYGQRAMTVLGQVVTMRPVRPLNPVRQATAPGAATPAARTRTRLGRLCLLLNAAHTDGLSQPDLLALAAFFRPLQAWCQAAGIDLRLRPKPASHALVVLASVLGLDPARLAADVQQPLDEAAQASDLCVLFGEASSALLNFIEAGCAVVNAVHESMPVGLPAYPALLAGGVVPVLGLNEALQRIQTLAQQPEALADLAARQAAALAQRAQGASDRLFDPCLQPERSAVLVPD